jgi:hypothetical protein
MTIRGESVAGSPVLNAQQFLVISCPPIAVPVLDPAIGGGAAPPYFMDSCCSPTVRHVSMRSRRPSAWVMSRPHHLRRTSK